MARNEIIDSRNNEYTNENEINIGIRMKKKTKKNKGVRKPRWWPITSAATTMDSLEVKYSL